MEKSTEMLRMEKDLNASEELREKFNSEMERIAKSGEAKSDEEVMVKAAAALGYQISLSELEQAQAEMQELDLEEMDAVAGGANDGKGHSTWCVAVWHCHHILLHTESTSKETKCWEEYLCLMLEHQCSNAYA